ncbi:MAG TPA: CPBP family intramembrane glutamate endopeptidase, partial [Bradyrhizobium sp.]|nr:CPBP family intramembrane glutamate endopeptidase [Bradyrhizobium sp.]
MDSLNPESQIIIAPPETFDTPVWKFWGTAFWGFVVFAAMFVGQLAVVAWFLLQQSGPIN